MRKLFIQFYLLLFVCFLVMALLVGLVYKFTAERAGRQSMDDLMKSSLYLMRSELREIPPRDWNKTIKNLDLNLSFKLHIEPLSKFTLDPPTLRHVLPRSQIGQIYGEPELLQLFERRGYRVEFAPEPVAPAAQAPRGVFDAFL